MANLDQGGKMIRVQTEIDKCVIIMSTSISLLLDNSFILLIISIVYVYYRKYIRKYINGVSSNI